MKGGGAKGCNIFFAFLWFIRERMGEKIWWADGYPLPLPTDGRSTNAMGGVAYGPNIEQ